MLMRGPDVPRNSDRPWSYQVVGPLALTGLTWRGQLVLQSLEVMVHDSDDRTLPVQLHGRLVAGGLDMAGSISDGSRDVILRAGLRVSDQRISVTLTATALRPSAPVGVGITARLPLSLGDGTVTVEGSDGESVRCEVPALVAPGLWLSGAQRCEWQINEALTARIELDGPAADVLDLRNWGEPAFQLAATGSAGQRRAGWSIQQRMTIRMTEREPAASTDVASGLTAHRNRSRSSELSMTDATRVRRPQLGTSVLAAIDQNQLNRFAVTHLDHLRVDVDLSPDADWSELHAVRSIDVPLEVALHCNSPGDRLEEAMDLLIDSPVAVLLVITRGRPVTRPRDVRRVRRACSTLRGAGHPPLVLAGSDESFGMINDNRFELRELAADDVFLPITPQVHEETDDWLASSPRATTALVHSARIACSSPGTTVSPLALRPRRRAGSAPGVRLDAHSIDPRQQQPAGASWLVGELAALAAVRAARVTVAELSGPRGLYGWDTRPVPMGEVLFDLAEARHWLLPHSDDETLSAIAADHPDCRALWIANHSRLSRSVLLAEHDPVEIGPFSVARIIL